MKDQLTNKQVYELCTAMSLLNPSFLEPLLSGGLEKRYSVHPNEILNDLKNILLNPKTKIKLGKEDNGSFIAEEDQMGQMAKYLQSTDFKPSKDWNWLKNAESISKEILKSVSPKEVFWTPEQQFSMVIVTDFDQYRIYLGKNLETNYSASEVFAHIFSEELDIQPLLEKLMLDWHNVLDKLPENLKKYLYAFDYNREMSWKEYQTKYSEKYLGEEVIELKHRYKKLNHFAKDAVLLANLNEEWELTKKLTFSDFWLSKIVPKLKMLSVNERNEYYFSENLSEMCKNFLRTHLDVNIYSNIYASNSGERLDIYDKKDLENEIGFNWSNDKKFEFCFLLNNKKIELSFDFYGGEMMSEPTFK